MADPQKTVSAAAMQAEWQEIQAAQQNPARFQPLYQRYYDPIFRFIFRRTADMDLAEDVCSQVFLKAMQQLHKYQFRGVPFSAWLFRIASNEVAQHFRTVKNKRTVSVTEGSLADVAEEMDLNDSGFDVQEMVQALDQLKIDDITLIEMRFFEQRPFKEIAEILDITESNAKVRTYRILERLRKKMIAQKT
ncbi:MAG: sigma-70 family RNA polymerase sigma factor [Bacteroidota bacterium]